ncbi:MAG: hypothetical protein V4673_08645, partial [Pseudomonadota bacterium]
RMRAPMPQALAKSAVIAVMAVIRGDQICIDIPPRQWRPLLPPLKKGATARSDGGGICSSRRRRDR